MGNTLLHESVVVGDLNIFKFLLQIRKKEAFKGKSLLFTVFESSYKNSINFTTNCVESLANLGVDFNVVNKNEQSIPEFIAFRNYQVEKLNWIYEKFAKISKKQINKAKRNNLTLQYSKKMGKENQKINF